MSPDTDTRWRVVWRLLREDRRRMKDVIAQSGADDSFFRSFFPGFTCVCLFRVSHHLLQKRRRRLARWCWMLNAYLTGANIDPSSEIDGGLYIPHPAGVTIHCKAGRNLTVMACAGIGPFFSEDVEGGLEEIPVLGDHVFLAHHAGIYSAVKVGNEVHLAPGCNVTHDVGDRTTLVGPPLKARRLAAAGRR